MKNKISKWDVGGGSRSIIQGLNLFTSRNLFKSLKSILMVVALLSLSSNVWGAWTKVTSAPTDWSGEYLLVYEDNNSTVAWTGVDAAKCNVAVTISSGSIADKPTGAVSLTIATMTGGYSIKVNGGTNDGKYIKGTSGSNALGFNDNAQLNTISYDATNKGVLITSNTSVMRYNAGASDCRFRYYKSTTYSSQKIVQLYKAPSTFSVTYNGNNATSGSVPTDATAYSSDASVTVLGNTGNLVKTGKKFGGWNTNSSGTGTTYQAGGTFNISANTTLYAKWDDITYTDYLTDCATTWDVTIAQNENTWGTVSQAIVTGVADQTVVSASSNVLTIGITEITATPTSQDDQYTYAFSNWTNIPVSGKITEDVTITANFTRTARTYDVTYKDQGGANYSGSNAGSLVDSYTSGTGATLVAGTKYGFNFEGWYDNQGCTGSPITTISNSATGNKTFYAKWSENLNCNWVIKGSWDGWNDTDHRFQKPTGQSTSSTGSVTISIASAGIYEFKLRQTDGSNYDCGADYTYEETKVIGDNIQLCSSYNPNCKINAKVPGNYTFTIDYSTSTDCPKLAVQYPDYVTVTFNMNGHGDAIVDKYCVPGETISAPVDPSAANYSFGGWYENASCTGDAFNFSTTLNANKTLYAKWTFEAPTYYYKGNQTNWSSVVEMTPSADHLYSYFAAKGYDNLGSNNNFLIQTLSTGGTIYGGDYLSAGFNGTNITNMGKWDGLTNACIYNAADFYIIVYYPNTAINSSSDPKICASTSLPGNFYVDGGAKLYFDNTLGNWAEGKQHLRIGRNNHSMAVPMTKVTGTANLYQCTVPEYANYFAFTVANSAGWTGNDRTIYQPSDVTPTGDYEITEELAYQNYLLDVDYTLLPTSKGSTEKGCTYINTNHEPGMKMQNVSITEYSHGTVNVAYTDIDGSASNFTTGNRNVAHTCILTITATPETGARLVSLKVNGNNFTSGQTFVANATTVITAVFSNEWTLTWDYADGSVVSAGTAAGSVAYGTSLTAPILEKTGYDFAGWNPAVPATMPAANSTYTAQWSLNSHSVTFDANGHGVAPTGYANVNYGALVAKPTDPADVDESGDIYTFIGWYKEAGCTNAWNFATDVMPDNDLTLYAKWSSVTYEDYRTHCCTPLPAPTGGEANDVHMTTATLSWNAVTNNNGYQVSADQTSWTNVPSGTSYDLTDLTAGTHYIYYVRAKGDNDVYCQYGTSARIEFTTKAALHITYNANGGTGADVVSGDIEEGTSATVAGNTFTAQTGMTFNGWNTATDGTGTAYAVGAIINPLNADLTLYAQWIGATFSVTYDLADGTGGCESTTATYNSTFTICSTIPTKGTNAFTGWSSNVEIGGKSTFQAGETFTMPASNVTLTAQWTASYTVTYVINNVEVSGPNPAGDVYVAQGQPTTLPDFTFNCGLYNQFIGWVDATVAEQDEKIPCPDLVGKAGDSFTPTGNITLYALFGHDAENLGWVKQTTISSGKYLMSDGTRVMTGFNSESTSINFLSAITAADDGNGKYATKPTNAAELEVNVLGNGQFTMMLLSNNQYLAATSGSYLNPSASATDACKWELMDGNTQPTTDLGTMPQGSIHSVNYTSVGLLGNTNQVRFTCYDKISGKSVPYLYKLINEGYYTTSPTCEIPTSVTVTYNKNTVDDVTMCEDAVLEFDEIEGYPTLAEPYTLCAADDVVREGYVLRKWNTAANGTGKDYKPDTVFTELGNDLNLYAQWDRVYTVTLHDNGATTPKTQASEGAPINLGAGKDAGECDLDDDGTPDFTWTFVGWTTNNMTLVEYPVCPEVIANPSGYIPEANIDLYAVYSRPIENTTAFAAGVSGAYIVKDNTETKYLGATTNNTKFHFSAQSAQSDAIVIKLVENNGSYNVATEAGFVEWDESTYMHYEQQMNNHWTISGSAGAWSMRESVDSRYLCWNQVDKFNLQQSKRTVDLIPTTGTYYFSNPVCQDKFDITFETRGGEINYGEALPEDYTGLASGAIIADFPTIDMRADLMDWTFVGWTTVDYNTQHALDDENASTEAPTSTIYRTGGANTFTMPSTNVTLYPVFTSAIKNEPMDLENGGNYYVYFTSDQPGYHDPYTDIDGQTIRVYAQNTGGNEALAAFASTTSCANAQLFHFEQREAGKWDIRLWNNAGDAYITKSYLTNPGANDNDFASQAAQPEGYWTIEQLSDGSFKAQYSVNAGTKYFMKGWVSSPATQASATFKCYSEDCDNSTQYYAVYLGSCVERTFSADPMPLSDLRIEGSVNVTSRTGVAVRATNFLTLKGIKLEAGQKVTITSTNTDIYFSDTKEVNMSKANKPVKSLQITIPASGSIDTTIYVHYQPTATVDGIESVTVTAGYNYNETDLTSDVKIRVRHLPEQVVIAAKVNDQWYALPANLSGATNPLVTPITVDEATMTAEAPTNCAYTLWPVKTTDMSGDRYQEVGERVRFSAVNNGNKGLWASDAKDSHTTINNDAAITGITANPAAPYYEWAISTNDLQVYTLTATGVNNTSNLSVARPTSGGNQGQLVWGTYGTNVTAEVYLLPFTAFTDMQATVVEWFQDKVLVELTNGDIWTAMSGASAQTQSRIGSAEWATAAAVDYTTYGTNMCTFNTGSLTSSYGQNLSIKTVVDGTTYQTTLVVPIIIGSNKSVTVAPFTTITPAKYNTMDVVVRDSAVLTLNGTSDEQTTFNTITIEPRSKVVVNSGRNLGAAVITMRGGYDEIYKDGHYTMSYDEPQLYIGGTCSATQVNYEKRVDLDQMHGMSVPFEVAQTAISYLNGTSVKKGGNLFIDAYDGEKRADYAGTKSSWYYYDETENPLYRGVGYTVSGAPMIETQKYAILRFPMATGWTKAVPGSESAAEVQVYAWGHDAAIRDNHKGWNCLGNPYLANFGKADDATFGGKLYVGQLVKTEDDKENWTGGYHWNDEMVRYVTIPHDDGHGFDQVRVQDAVLKPFRHFFVQVKTTGTLTFDKGNIQNSVVARAMNDEPKEIELGILMSNGQVTDNCGLLIGDDFSEGYEMMSDLGKELGQAMAIYTITGDYKLAFNAMNEDYAKGYVPVGYLAPKAGEYTISFDNDRYDIAPCVEHIYLLENGAPVADLKSVDYRFETTAGTNDDRFALSIVFNHNIATDLSGVDSMDEMPVKIVHNDKMYILMRGKVYSTTGKFIKAIKK